MVYLYATTLPSHWKFAGLTTHTFITIENEQRETIKYAAYGPEHNVPFFGINMLSRKYFKQDKSVFTGEDTKNLKAKIPVPVPEGKTEEEFIHDLVDAIDSYDNKDMLRYNFIPFCNAEGNCNTSTSTVLFKSGVSMECIKQIKRRISGFKTGFGFSPKPWTLKERQTAIERQSKSRIEKLNEKGRQAMRSCPSLIHLLHFCIPEISPQP